MKQDRKIVGSNEVGRLFPLQPDPPGLRSVPGLDRSQSGVRFGIAETFRPEPEEFIEEPSRGLPQALDRRPDFVGTRRRLQPESRLIELRTAKFRHQPQLFCPSVDLPNRRVDIKPGDSKSIAPVKVPRGQNDQGVQFPSRFLRRIQILDRMGLAGVCHLPGRFMATWKPLSRTRHANPDGSNPAWSKEATQGPFSGPIWGLFDPGNRRR